MVINIITIKMIVDNGADALMPRECMDEYIELEAPKATQACSQAHTHRVSSSYSPERQRARTPGLVGCMRLTNKTVPVELETHAHPVVLLHVLPANV
jgi:hypothetical protein